jgi:pilus assembly protein CpaC
VGIHWPLEINGTGNYSMGLQGPINGAGKAYSGTWNMTVGGQAQFGLGFLFTDGYQRVLAQPKLVCASGERAKFMSGGEVPIPMITQMMVKVDFKPFGVMLNIGPTADRHGNIQMDIFTEVSEIDHSLGITVEGLEIPGFAVDRSETNVTVRHGQTIVLSGLFHHLEGKNLTKVPLLGHIPIIGELFKSRMFEEKKSEVCVFVTPRIVNPDTPKILKMISDIKSRYKRARDEVGFGIFD